MDNNLIKRTLQCKKNYFNCILNNALSLLVYLSFERIFITYFVFLLLVHVPHFPSYIHRHRESCVYMMLAHIPVHFIRDMVYYLRRFAWRTRVSMFHALRFCLRSRGFQRCVLFPTHARVRNPRHLHRDAMAMRRWHTADVVADRAGFVDNEPSFMNGSPVTKPGRLRPCLVLFLMLSMLLPHWYPSDTMNNILYWVSLFNSEFYWCEYFFPAYLKKKKILAWLCQGVKMKLFLV